MDITPEKKEPSQLFRPTARNGDSSSVSNSSGSIAHPTKNFTEHSYQLALAPIVKSLLPFFP
jgi:hypothetical protein